MQSISNAPIIVALSVASQTQAAATILRMLQSESIVENTSKVITQRLDEPNNLYTIELTSLLITVSPSAPPFLEPQPHKPFLDHSLWCREGATTNRRFL